MPMDQLPEEIVYQILYYLDCKDVFTCCLVSKQFKNIIQTSNVIQYDVELEVSGILDGGSSSTLSVADRLTELKTVEHNWAHLKFRAIYTTTKPWSRLWELFGGVLAFGTAGQLDVVTGLSFTELPSVVRGTEPRTWEHRDMGVNIRDFGMEPSQDLAVLVVIPSVIGAGPNTKPTFTIHLKSMKTGKNHPEAREPLIVCRPDILASECSFVIQVMGDFLGILFEPPMHVRLVSKEEVYIWNWKTGKVVSICKIPLVDVRISSFSFISTQHFIISSYVPSADPPITPALSIYDFLDSDNDKNEPNLYRKFILPELNDTAMVNQIITRLDPSPTKEGSPVIPAGSPFYTAPSSRILCVSIDIVTDRAINYSWMLFVFPESLLDDPYPDSPGGIPWSEWGPDNTRLVPLNDNQLTWVCYVHGTRFVTLIPHDDVQLGEVPSSRLHVYEFSPLLLRRELHGGYQLEDTESAEIEFCPRTHATTIDVDEYDGVFAEDVETRLPYRSSVSKQDYKYAALMMEENCLIGFVRNQALLSITEKIEFLCI